MGIVARNEVGLRIQQRLKAVGKTAQSAGQEIGAPKTFICSIVIGRRKSGGAARMAALSRVLECDVHWLITGLPAANHLTAHLETLKQQAAAKVPSLQHGGAA